MDTRILLYWSVTCLMTYVIICTGFVQSDAASAVKGSIIQLKCPYRTSVGNRIYWKKDVNGGFVGYTEGTNINPSLPLELSSRLTVTGDHSTGEYNLNISDVRRSDEGTYECGLSGSNFKRFQLSVITNIPTSVSIGNVGLDKKLNGIEGRDLMLSCSAEGGDPAPDVKLLISESVVKTAKQSVQYLLSSPNRSYDGQNVKCLAGYEEIPYYPLNNSAKIYLKLKPYPPTFNADSLNTGEIKPLEISCTSTGSRPKSSIYWLLGDGKTNITANATLLPISHDATTDTYSVTSTLKYMFDRIYNGKHLICGASNEVTLEQGDGIETSKTLNVTYAPDITVTSPTYTQDDAIRTVTCNPNGNPDSYTYHKWQHMSKYGEIILREFGGNKTLKLPNAPVLLRYQDSGKYVCSASNGIMDKGNKFEQTGSGSVTVRAQPVFTTDTIDKVKQFGEIDKTVDIYVNVYSVSKFSSYKWDQDGTELPQNSAKYVSSSSPTIVKDKIHGKEVQLDGFNVSLTIHDLKNSDLANYTVTLKSEFQDVKFTILLESASVPETPGNFTLVASSATSITVQWDPHSGGGYKQVFYIQFRVQGSASWTTVSAGKEDINEQRRRRTYEVKNLQKEKPYELRMYAENTAIKRSNFTEALIAYTQSSEAELPIAAIIGGVAGGLTAIIIVLLIIVFVQKNRKESGTPSTKLRASSESDEEDGLKDNILYESSQSDGLKKNILYQSAGPNVESQKKSQTSSEYAVVQKPNAIYAEVNKATQLKNGKEKKKKDTKEKPKKARKEKVKAVNNNPNDEYANSALQLKNLNNEEYANSTDTQGTSNDNTNAQGLEYADLTFRQIPTKNKKQVIHGIDERTIYADVDHTKKAPPPPQESEYEETNIKHGKLEQ